MAPIGISYPPIEEDRSATMPRLDGKKARIRQANLLSTLPGSEEHLSGQGEGGRYRVCLYVCMCGVCAV